MKDQKTPISSEGVNTARVYRRKVTKSFSKPSRTHQSFKDECDINHIVSRFNKTGQLPDLIKTNPKYGDFSDPVSYQESLNLVQLAEAQFGALSSRVRERFHNDPVLFLQFTSDEKNLDEMVELGLAVKQQIKPQKNDDQTANNSSPPKNKTSKKESDENS